MTFEIPATTREAQARASHPEQSAWVSANAGSGKTFVLARRVIRLLLAGTEPSRILCLTFTKAAAAEMSNRVFKALSGWTHLSDEALSRELAELTGQPTNAARLSLARRLFARALETPGGLKIQTIHAFAERLLHQFPLEANVPAHFEILDDQLSKDLLQQALSSTMRLARTGDRQDWAIALNQLIDHMGDLDIQAALISLVHDREGFARFMERSEAEDEGGKRVGLEAALASLAGRLGVDAGDSLAAIEAAIPNSPHFSAERLSSLAPLFEQGGKRDKEQAALMRALLAEAQTDRQTLKQTGKQASLWFSLFRKKDGSAKSLSFMASKGTLKAEPDLEDWIEREQGRLDGLQDRKAAVMTLEVSRALFTLAEGVISHYERAKTARGLMDFDDLIIKAADLLRPANAAAWVHYKLDQGIDHILVDEAQDTNPRQWEIIRQLGEEFFSGEGARPVERTIFAVGDEKQSIYSFQGAQPKWFAMMRDHFRQQADEAGKVFHKIDLQLSFRSTPHILKAVDEVFSTEPRYGALTADREPTVHEAIRHRDPGLVEIWPLTEPVEQELDDDWARPLDTQGEASPIVQLARTIAATIKDWLKQGAILEGSGKPIEAGDILILVRKRGAFVDAVNRALKEADLPVAGADRLALLDHIAVMDLLSLGDVMVLPEDDLSLAAVLRSPLFNVSEERLFDLARAPVGQPKRSLSLWESLRRAAMQDPSGYFDAIFSQLSRWQGQIDFQPPFDFYAQLLGPGGRRRAFIERLGPEADEVIDEFLSRALDFEKSQTPNLQAFLAAMRQGGAEVKRDMGAASGQIRVMTVHGSKGLEAPIVFLVDGTGKPASATHHPHLVKLEDEKGGSLMAWKAPRTMQPSPVSESLMQLDLAAEAEYLRLLYVGMTRAEDRLYLCGHRGKRDPAENCWYQVTQTALAGQAKEETHPISGDPILRWTLAQDFTPKEQKAEQEGSYTDKQRLPDWVHRSLAAPQPEQKPLRPSDAADKQDLLVDDSKAPPCFMIQKGVTYGWEPRRRGTLLHSLFEHLPSLPADQRHTRGLAYLASVASDMPLLARQTLLDEVLDILIHPDHASLFGPDSQPEVSIAGWLDIGGEMREISGQVDLLRVDEESVLIIDFKTGYHVPQNAQAIPMDYQTQMALYARVLEPLFPGKRLQTLLFWTSGPVVMEVSESQRQSALDQIGVR